MTICDKSDGSDGAAASTANLTYQVRWLRGSDTLLVSPTLELQTAETKRNNGKSAPSALYTVPEQACLFVFCTVDADKPPEPHAFLGTFMLHSYCIYQNVPTTNRSSNIISLLYLPGVGNEERNIKTRV